MGTNNDSTVKPGENWIYQVTPGAGVKEKFIPIKCMPHIPTLAMVVAAKTRIPQLRAPAVEVRRESKRRVVSAPKKEATMEATTTPAL